ncbi:MAG TPA: hypothetical protein VLF41_03365, partial [Candidatus Nanoarchaeia archaeon]|nr:hypothetical protein [Candidatus Nanoarchaeia archaeon]
MPKAKKSSKKKSSQLIKLAKGFSRQQLALLVVVLVGLSYLVFRTFAAQGLQYKAAGDSIVMEYTEGHAHKPLSDRMDAGSAIPFRLYGNGLAICGQENDPAANQQYQLNSTKLSPTDMQTLIQKVAGTGFLQLKPEYYDKYPLDVSQSMMRLKVKNGDHIVFYYGGVAEPAAWTQTKAIIKQVCAGATTAYVPDKVNLRIKKVQSTKGQTVASSWLGGEQLPTKKSVTDPESRLKTGPEATKLLNQLGSKTHGLYTAKDGAYEVAVDKLLPDSSDEIKRIDYNKLRSGKTALGSSAALADGTMPVRTVIFFTTDTGSGDVNTAAARGTSVHDWYCGQVGSCFPYQGASIIRGGQTAAWYMTCHQSNGCPNGVYEA